jgi:hypothetical protein
MHHRHATATTAGVSTPSTNARNGAPGAGPTRSIGMQPRPPLVCGKARHKRTHSQSNQCQYGHRCGKIGPSPGADVAGACRCGTSPGADVPRSEHSPWRQGTFILNAGMARAGFPGLSGADVPGGCGVGPVPGQMWRGLAGAGFRVPYGADVARAEPGRGADMARDENSPGAEVGWMVGYSSDADVAPAHGAARQGTHEFSTVL